MAQRVVTKFGLETLEVMENRPEYLLEVEGIGKIRAERINDEPIDLEKSAPLIDIT